MNPGDRARWVSIVFPLLGVGALVLVLGFRVIGLNFDMGTLQHPDERFLVMLISQLSWPGSVAEFFDSSSSPLNPFNVPGLSFYVYGNLPVFVGKAFADLSAHLDHFGLASPGRVLATAADLATLLSIFFLSRRVFDDRTAWLAACLYGFMVLPIQLSNFFTVDPFLCLFLTLALVGAVDVVRGASLMVAAKMGVWWACALASKLSAISFAPVWFVTVWIVFRQRGRRQGLAFMAMSMATTAIGFRVFNPYAFDGIVSFDPRFFEAFRMLAETNTVDAWFPPSFQWVQRTPLIYPLQNLALFGVGPALFLAAIVGVAIGLKRVLKRGDPAFAVLLVSLLSVFVLVAVMHVQTMRYLLPAYPVFAILAAYALGGSWCSRVPAGWRALPAAVVVGASLLWATAFTEIYRSPMTRIVATKWIHENLPAGATIGVEHWDDALPLRLPGYDADRFGRVELEPVAKETDEKRERLLQRLHAADYLILASERGYASVARLPEAFPLAIRYYEMLFDGSAGFRLVADITSYPRFGAWVFRDDFAEEAFKVYDHPRVLIYEKTEGFSLEKLAAAFDAVVLPVPAWNPHGRGPVRTLTPAAHLR